MVGCCGFQRGALPINGLHPTVKYEAATTLIFFLFFLLERRRRRRSFTRGDSGTRARVLFALYGVSRIIFPHWCILHGSSPGEIWKISISFHGSSSPAAFVDKFLARGERCPRLISLSCANSDGICMYVNLLDSLDQTAEQATSFGFCMSTLLFMYHIWYILSTLRILCGRSGWWKKNFKEKRGPHA